MCYKLRSLLILVIASAQLVGCASQPKSAQSSMNPNPPIIKIAVMADGRITVDGSPATVESLRVSLKRLADQKGAVWYYREAPQAEPPPQAMQVMQAVIDNRLPIKLSTRPDYSDDESEGRLPAQVMRELRTKMLTTPARDFGIQPTKTFPRVYGALMDWPVGDDTATIVSFCDGNASLYTTSTFGVIGGAGHDSVRAAATNFVRTAATHYDTASPAKEYPYPKQRRVRFYLLCFDGVRLIETDEAALKSGKDRCSDLWTEGQRVMTELRLITEKEDKRP